MTLVFQSAVLGYLAPKDRERVHASLADAGADGRLAYVGTHSPRDGSDGHYGLVVQTWPGEREVVAHADFHGAWLEWLA